MDYYVPELEGVIAVLKLQQEHFPQDSVVTAQIQLAELILSYSHKRAFAMADSFAASAAESFLCDQFYKQFFSVTVPPEVFLLDQSTLANQEGFFEQRWARALQERIIFYLHAVRNKKSDTEVNQFLKQLEDDHAWSVKPLKEDQTETGLVLYTGVATISTTRILGLYATLAQSIVLHCLRQFSQDLRLQVKDPTHDSKFWESTPDADSEAAATEARVFSQNPDWPTPQTP